MRRADVPAVHAIECDSYPYPWSRSIFADCMRIGYCCRVAEIDGVVGAYAILSAGAGESHLLNLCVARSYRRLGVGQLLLHGVAIDAGLLGAQRVFLEVRPSNEAAVALYETNGFRVIGRRPDYYPAATGREDALVMVRHLGDGDD
jgi:ribosomal-protein-alanine N-acetyltransferase